MTRSEKTTKINETDNSQHFKIWSQALMYRVALGLLQVGLIFFGNSVMCCSVTVANLLLSS